MRFVWGRRGRFGGIGDAQFVLLLGAEQVAPVAGFIPIGAVEFDGVLNAFAAVAALQVFGFAVFVAAPADALGVFGEDGEFFCHDVTPAHKSRAYFGRVCLLVQYAESGKRQKSCSVGAVWGIMGFCVQQAEA